MRLETVFGTYKRWPLLKVVLVKMWLLTLCMSAPFWLRSSSWLACYTVLIDALNCTQTQQSSCLLLLPSLSLNNQNNSCECKLSCAKLWISISIFNFLVTVCFCVLCKCDDNNCIWWTLHVYACLAIYNIIEISLVVLQCGFIWVSVHNGTKFHMHSEYIIPLVTVASVT